MPLTLIHSFLHIAVTGGFSKRGTLKNNSGLMLHKNSLLYKISSFLLIMLDIHHTCACMCETFAYNMHTGTTT